MHFMCGIDSVKDSMLKLQSFVRKYQCVCPSYRDLETMTHELERSYTIIDVQQDATEEISQQVPNKSKVALQLDQ